MVGKLGGFRKQSGNWKSPGCGYTKKYGSASARSSGRTSDITDFEDFFTNAKICNEPIMSIEMCMRDGARPMLAAVVSYQKAEDALGAWRSMVGLPGSSSA